MTTIPVNGWRYEQEALDLAALVRSKLQIPVEADFNNHVLRAGQSLNPEQLKDIILMVTSSGYGIPITETFARVVGMSCSACAVSTADILRHLPGILKADVNYANQEVLLRYVQGMISIQEMRSALQNAGYDLEAEGAENEPQTSNLPTSIQLKRKAFGAMAFAVPLFVVGMFGMHWPYADYVMWALASPLVFYFGKDFYVRSWKLLRHGHANMDTLVALSTGIAYAFSVFNLLFRDFWHQGGLPANVYFEASGVIIAFILLGKWLEENARQRTSAAIQQLMHLQPSTAAVQKGDGTIAMKDIALISPGEIIIARPGERMAVDGIVVSGISHVDESLLTGEPIPVLKEKGSKVFAGTINQEGSLQYKAEGIGKSTRLAQIIRIVRQAQGSRAPVQKLTDKIASVFVPVVVAIASLAAIFWWIFGGENSFHLGLLSMITVLVIACPCALGLATPTALMVGIGRGAKEGILIKDAGSLEMAKKINTVVLDKTGTLTEGKPLVTDVFWKEQEDIPSLEQILYSIESVSEHPLSKAVTACLKQHSPLPPSSFRNIPGMGVEATLNGRRYMAGNLKMLQTNGVDLPDAFIGRYEEWQRNACTIIFLADERKVLGMVALKDSLKKHAAKSVSDLQRLGLDVILLTGDQFVSAKAVADATGIRRFEAGVSPEGKADFVRSLQRQGKRVAMVGDGINDAAALALADLSIAMAKGSDIAMEAAGITLMHSDPDKIPAAIALSKRTVKIIRQNLFWAFIYNLLGIPLAAGILYPYNGFLMDPMIAGAAMALSSISVVSNSLRLGFCKIVD